MPFIDEGEIKRIAAELAYDRFADQKTKDEHKVDVEQWKIDRLNPYVGIEARQAEIALMELYNKVFEKLDPLKQEALLKDARKIYETQHPDVGQPAPTVRMGEPAKKTPLAPEQVKLIKQSIQIQSLVNDYKDVKEKYNIQRKKSPLKTFFSYFGVRGKEARTKQLESLKAAIKPLIDEPLETVALKNLRDTTALENLQRTAETIQGQIAKEKKGLGPSALESMCKDISARVTNILSAKEKLKR